MNADPQPAPLDGSPLAAALPDGHGVGCFELQSVWQRSSAAVVYRAWDHALVRPVAIKEYLPAAWAQRDANGMVRPIGPGTAAAFERGLHGFADEARTLARCDHPSLVRVLDLLETGGTAYRVMPWYDSLSLLDVRRKMAGPFGEPALRKLLDQLLGALAAYQRAGGVHRGVNPSQVLLLDEDHAMLLGPGAASRAPSTALADTLAAPLEPGYAAPEQTHPSGQPHGPWTDFYALAELARFCITGLPPPPPGSDAPEPLAATVERLFPGQPAVRYSADLLRALDAAMVPDVTRRPQTAAQWRDSLLGAPPPQAASSPGHSLHTVDATTQALIRRVIDSIDEPGLDPMQEPNYELTEPTPLAARSEPLPLHADPSDRSSLGAQPRPPARRRRRVGWASAAVAVVGLGAWGLLGQQPLRQTVADEPLVAALEVPVTQAQAPVAAPPVTAAVTAPVTAAVPAAVLPERAASLVVASPAVAKPSEPLVAKTQTDPPARTAAPAAPATRAAKSNAVERTLAASPRQECGARTAFSLYRCMQQQCGLTKWQRHPQCVQLEATDSVD